jgi:hypothetical protein
MSLDFSWRIRVREHSGENLDPPNQHIAEQGYSGNPERQEDNGKRMEM